MLFYERPKDKDPIMRLWLHEQTLVSLDGTSRSFTLSSSWRRVNLRMARQSADGAADDQNTTALSMGKDYRRWTQGLTVSTQQAKVAMLESAQQSRLHAAPRGLRLTPVAKAETEIRAIASYAGDVWMKHDAMKMMEETNKLFHEQIKEDMRAFVASSPTPTLPEWAKTSVWAADTGGTRDDSSSPIRAQRGVWKRLFEQVPARRKLPSLPMLCLLV